MTQPQSIAPIAIVGMSLRAPGAADLQQFWHNLRHGVESITFLTPEQLRAAGVSEAELANPDYVPAVGRLEGVDLFDAHFFDLTPREAEILDPQHRLLLEGVWQALEQAAIDPERYGGRIGLFAGVGLNSYLLHNLIGHEALLQSVGGWQLNLSNDKDFAATRVAYKLNLQGPAVSMNSACSTSLVATAMACQSLLSYQCDAVVAGGCSIHLPQDQGYLYHHGGTLSPDGHCRPFDAEAAGTIDGNGVALVVLKRLEDALAEGDTIYGLIRGFAINNDGSLKVGYTAPSVDGQSEVVAEALELAGLTAAQVSYIETHGTGTDLGDPVEVAALKQVFHHAGAAVGSCLLGAVKSNIGHLDTAAGAAGLIKTVLALHHQEIPPTLHFQRPNPKLGLEQSPFWVNAQLHAWPRVAGTPRRAGVSSFGIGGTNAHLIVEEAPLLPPSPAGQPWLLLPLAAKTATALDTLTTQLADHLEADPEQPLADVAYTLQVGRRHFEQRRVVLVRGDDRAEAVARLRQLPSQWVFKGGARSRDLAPIFLFPGQDAQFVNMAVGLYRDEPQFRAALQRCAELARQRHGYDLLAQLYPEGVVGAKPRPDTDSTTEPLPLFAVEYALAQLWISWGVQPRALLGYSLGEYVAATLAGVLTLEEGLDLAVAGSALLKEMVPGAMLAVALSAEALAPLLQGDVHLALAMATHQSVVAGTVAAVAILKERLTAEGAHWREVGMGLPFHTPLMEPFLAPFRQVLQRIRFQPPQIPYLSSVTGDWISPAEATSPDYYLRLASQALRIDKALATLFADLTRAGEGVLLEVGPGQLLTSLALQHPDRPAWLAVISSQHDPRYGSGDRASPHDDQPALLAAVARLWSQGVAIDWAAFSGVVRRRVALPSYPLERHRFWIDPAPRSQAGVVAPTVSATTAAVTKDPDLSRWFYRPEWRRQPLVAPETTPQGRWLLLASDRDRLEAWSLALSDAGCEVVEVLHHEGSLSGSAPHFDLNLTDEAELRQLLVALGDWQPDQILHLGLWGGNREGEELKNRAFYGLLYLGRALGQHYFSADLTLTLLADGLLSVTGSEELQPLKSSALGPLRVIPQEYPNIACRVIDAVTTLPIAQLLAEVAHIRGERTVALRGRYRWIAEFEPLPLAAAAELPKRLRSQGVYLITGGLGHVGRVLATYLAETVQACLVLVSRRAMPAREEWEDLLEDPTTPPLLAAQLRTLQRLEEAGSELLLLSADVADSVAMAKVLTTAEHHFGRIDGVIHAAGLVGEASLVTINDSSGPMGRLASEQQFRPKVDGALVLAHLLHERSFDFCLFCSSLSPLLGGLGFSAYAATNWVVDTLAEQLNQQQPGKWLSINWEGWDFDEEVAGGNTALAALELGMRPEEGREVFARIMADPRLERVVVSSGSLAQRLAQWVDGRPDTAAPLTAESATLSTAHPRPDLLGDYVAPTTETEQQLVALWGQLLGIAGIGVEDNFFELGGNSLLLTQLVAMMRRTFRVELSLIELFEAPTIGAIAAQIEAAHAPVVESEWDEGVL